MTKDEELALLGILEGQLGEHQRVMNGMHLDEQVIRRDHAAFLRLQRQVAADRAAAEPIPSPSVPHPWLRAIVVPIAVFLSTVCIAVLFVLLSG